MLYISRELCLFVYLYFCIFLPNFVLHSVGVPLQTDWVFMRTLFTIPVRLDLSYFCMLCIFKSSAFTAECIQWHRSQGKLETLEQREYIRYFIQPAVKRHRKVSDSRKIKWNRCLVQLRIHLPQDMTWSSKSAQKASSSSPRLPLQVRYLILIYVPYIPYPSFLFYTSLY